MLPFIKHIIKSILGFLIYQIAPRKNVVFILSSMRSGSTLLKALLAEAPEITHLNEIQYIPSGNKYADYFFFYRLGKGRIILVKRPAFYDEVEQYPVLPKKLDFQQVILFRNPADTIISLKDMNKHIDRNKSELGMAAYLKTTMQQLSLSAEEGNTHVVFYESLLDDAKGITKQLFEFIGSDKKDGVEEYSKPAKDNWKWGNDDGGEVIQSLKVQQKPKHPEYDGVKSLLEKETSVWEQWEKVQKKFEAWKV